MAQKPETVFRARFVKKIKPLPNLWVESIQQQSISGTPDQLACINGKFVALEYKKDYKSKLSPLQAYKKELILKAGGIFYRVYPENAEEILALLINLTKG